MSSDVQFMNIALDLARQAAAEKLCQIAGNAIGA